PNIFSPVSVGTPQGSPISPLLFVIYISSLHLSIPMGISMFSYIDNCIVTIGSLSYRRNTQRLWHYYCTLKRRANSLGVFFSIPKTELCHGAQPGTGLPSPQLQCAWTAPCFTPHH